MADEAGAARDVVATDESPCELLKYGEVKGSHVSLPARPTTLLKSSSSPGKMISDKRRPPLNRATSIKEKISHETAKFFGVYPDPMPDEESTRVEAPTRTAEEQKWQQRRFRHLKHYGVKPELVEKQLNPEPKIGIDALTDLMAGQAVSDGSDRSEQASRSSRTHSIDSRGSRMTVGGPPRLERRDSVAKMAYDTLSSIVQGNTFRRSRRRKVAEKTQEEAPYMSIRNPRYSLMQSRSFLTKVPRSGAVSPYEMPDAFEFSDMPTSTTSAMPDISRFRHGYRSIPAHEHRISEEISEELPSSTSREKGEMGESTESDKSKSSRIKPKLSRAEGIDMGDEKVEAKEEPKEAKDEDEQEVQRPRDLPLRVRFDSGKGRPALEPIDTTVRAQGRSPILSAMSTIDDEVFYDFDMTPTLRSRPAFHIETHHPEDFPHTAATRFNMPAPPAPMLASVSVPHRPAPFPVDTSPSPEIRVEKEYGPMDPHFYDKTPVHNAQFNLTRPRTPSITNAGMRIKPRRPNSQSTTEGNRITLGDALRAKEQNVAVFQPPGYFQRFRRMLRSSISRPGSMAEGSFKALSRYIHRRDEQRQQRRQQRRRQRQSLPILGSIYKKDEKREMDPKVSRQLDDESYDYRPYFTWYITTVQVILCLYYICVFGIGTDFASLTDGVVERSGDVLATSLSTVHIVTWEQNNYWIGPSFANLVHMGAKYTPCMRHDRQIYEKIYEERRLESDTGCCIGIDGCYQTSECPRQFASYMKFTNSTPSEKAIRAVCGQDPRYCNKPRSIQPFEWGENITDWPVCEERASYIPTKATHMTCEIVGRPCCIQMQGQCRITTKEYCDFVRGYYHENATLCSQVDCLNDICGMTPFMIMNRPDQYYRFVLPLFIHAGIIRLIITVLLQMTVMRKFEIMIGWFRLGWIYLFSGFGGYLASAAFEPYMPETGPAGSQGGVLGAIIVDIMYNWKYIQDPIYVLFMHVMITMILIVLGFIPFVDNWAQIFGLIFGALWAAVLIPYMGEKRLKRLIVIGSCLTAIIFLYAFLLILFASGYELSPKLSWLNCPFPGKICEHQGSKLKSWLPI